MAVDYSLYGGAEATERKACAKQAGKTCAGGACKKASECAAAADVSPPGRAPRRVFAPDEGENPDLRAHTTAPMDKTDFLWVMTEEPHRSRRQAIMKAHPEVTKLMGYEPLTKWVVLGVVALQLATALLLRNTSPLSPTFIFLAYAIGGTANHNLFLAIHEITHNLAFRSIWANKLLAIFANLPIGIPYSAAFKGYHIEHHKFQGVDGVDTDLPTKLELMCLNNVLGKVFFAYVRPHGD